MSKLDRTGEVGYNNFGSEMVIVKYRNCHDVDVYFEEYNYVVEIIPYYENEVLKFKEKIYQKK